MNSMKFFVNLVSLSVFLLFSPVALGQGEWQPLVSNGSMEGWEIKNGNAPYVVQGNTIIGTAVKKSPNTFLCTTKHYDDFILEFEVLVDSTVNSGVQFRSNSFPDYKEGQVHGYQAEIDPSERAWSGGIYEEGKRGWLYSLEENEEGRKAFKNGQWNHYRIEAIGNHLAIWVNGVNTANLEDGETARGFIGLQVHSIGKGQEAGREIKWRNLRILTYDLEKYQTMTTIPLKRLAD